MSALTGRNDGGCDDNCSKFVDGFDVDEVLASLSNLDKLEPYNPKNDMFTLVDASLDGLGFILFQKESKGRSSILQAGSTSLKQARVRWNISELELLAVKYMLNKCHFYTAYSRRQITIYSDCRGLSNIS